MNHKRILVGITGASGTIYGAEFLKRCPGEKYLVLTRWGKEILKNESGITEEDLKPYVKRIFSDDDMSSPFASGSNRYDALVIIPCTISTLAKIASGIGDSLLTRAAQVALKERRKMILAVRETPLSSITLEQALKLSRDGVVIMPISPPFYKNPETVDDLIESFIDKVMGVIGFEVPDGWKAEELE